MPIPSWLQNYDDLWLFEECRKRDRPLNNGLTKVVVGQFFEVLTANMYKAEHANPPEGWSVYPDVIKWGGDHDILYEVKGGAKDFIIDVGQIREYGKMCEKGFPFNNPEVKYVFFMHNLHDIFKTYKTINPMVEALCKSILLCVVMPFNIVKLFPEYIPLYEYGAWGMRDGKQASRGGFAHKHFLRLRKFRLTQWLKDTRSIRSSMIDVFGPCAQKWKFESRRVHRRKIMDNKVKGFDLVEIST